MAEDGLHELQQRVAAGDPQARELLLAALGGKSGRAGRHSEWGALCEAVGEFKLAMREYQLAIRDNPDDTELMARLAILYEEKGDFDHAVDMALRLWQRMPEDADALRLVTRLLVSTDSFAKARDILRRAEQQGAPEDLLLELREEVETAVREETDEREEEAAPGVPTESDVIRFVHLFSGRENIYARQWWSQSGEGGYSPVREPFTPKVGRNHLLGTITVGIYPVRLDNTVCFFAFDIDINKRAMGKARGNLREARRLKDLVSTEARRLHTLLGGLGLPSLMEDSGYKGRHLWLFLEVPEPAAIVRQFGTLFLNAFPLEHRELHVEFFPKQAAVGSGVGNLIKLPLGIHRRTGRRSRLLGPDGEVDEDPYGTLRRHPKVARSTLHSAIAELKRAVAAVSVVDGRTEVTEEHEDEQVDGRAVPEPPAPEAAWTAADFETNREVAHLLEHCPVLMALKEKVEEHRRLTHDEQVVLMHGLGHSGAGVLAVNYLLDMCVDIPPTTRLRTPLSGNPISCPKIRKRIPDITGRVPCNCLFDFAPDHYPNPRLHLIRLKSEVVKDSPAERSAALAWDPVDRVRALGVLWIRRDRLLQEVARLEKEILEYMERSGQHEIVIPDGRLALVQEEGAPPALVWHPQAQGVEQLSNG